MGACASAPATHSKKPRKAKRNVVSAPKENVPAAARNKHLPRQLSESVTASPLPEIEVEKRPILENPSFQLAPDPGSIPPDLNSDLELAPREVQETAERAVTSPKTLPVLSAETLKVPVFDHMQKPIRIVQTNPLFEISDRTYVQDHAYDDDEEEDYELAHRVEFVPTPASKQPSDSSKLRRSALSDNYSEISNGIVDNRDVESMDSKNLVKQANSPDYSMLSNSEIYNGKSNFEVSKFNESESSLPSFSFVSSDYEKTAKYFASDATSRLQIQQNDIFESSENVNSEVLNQSPSANSSPNSNSNSANRWVSGVNNSENCPIPMQSQRVDDSYLDSEDLQDTERPTQVEKYHDDAVIMNGDLHHPFHTSPTHNELSSHKNADLQATENSYDPKNQGQNGIPDAPNNHGYYEKRFDSNENDEFYEDNMPQSKRASITANDLAINFSTGPKQNESIKAVLDLMDFDESVIAVDTQGAKKETKTERPPSHLHHKSRGIGRNSFSSYRENAYEFHE